MAVVMHKDDMTSLLTMLKCGGGFIAQIRRGVGKGGWLRVACFAPIFELKSQ